MTKIDLAAIRYRRERGTTPRSEDVDALLARVDELTAERDDAYERIRSLHRYRESMEGLPEGTLPDPALARAADVDGDDGPGCPTHRGDPHPTCLPCMEADLAAVVDGD